ncbi:MerR family transcriptional regulator [Pseudofrankia asymbiotica]|uniref:MerR family transcriptional regulator n=1 Tax=Pseudofrankia asymbiotica TaxID=1834516 RepID=UPI003B75D20C
MIGQLAASTGLSVRTLRFYADDRHLGVVRPSPTRPRLTPVHPRAARPTSV